MKPSLLLLVDNEEYIRTNCYQSQLAETLELNYRVKIIPLARLKAGIGFLTRPVKFDRVLSVLRLRTLADNLNLLSLYLGNVPLCVYEQDVWQAYMDSSPWKGAYERIQSRLNIQKFLVTSQWWCSYVREKGIKADFVRMGMLPRFCDHGPDWDDRPYPLAFQGTIHPHRKVLIDAMKEQGLEITVLKSGPYEAFLKSLHQMQIYIHSEDDPWVVDGKLIPRNALWIKDTEAAARGTFALRNWDEDMKAYGTDELPTIFSYNSTKEIGGIVEEIRSFSSAEKRRRMTESAQQMRERNDWMTVVRAIEENS